MGQGWLIAADSGPLIPTFARGLAPPRKVHTRRVTPVIIKFAPVVRRRAGNIAKGGQIYRFDYRFPENRDDFEQSTPPPPLSSSFGASRKHNYSSDWYTFVEREVKMCISSYSSFFRIFDWRNIETTIWNNVRISVIGILFFWERDGFSFFTDNKF